MESTKHFKFVEVPIGELKTGMIIRIKKNLQSHRWLVLDVGKPFILIENLNTHFAQLYHPVTPLYLVEEVEPKTND